ncbi:MAG: tRNA uridine-5-carboxymethylaminomethyl(34) synthesis enzyme MnmG [Bacteroidales bacterium]|nr:tRNA uridine-5-carboxymethylaminomethyl(34) synthesis enzyme MnmG [Bacteroidales bacterium]
MKNEEKYDVVVVGAGHAGCEAAIASARLGSKTLLVTMHLGLVAQMSCNPAMGGIAKGQIVKEIDALGGFSGIVADQSTIQFRMLNRSKGPAMWSPRTQNDKYLFSQCWKSILEKQENLELRQDTVTDILVEQNKVAGIKTQQGNTFFASKIILTNGTFLNGRIHIGEVNFAGGRMGESNSLYLSDKLKDLGLTVKKLKTGTPVRIDKRTVDFSKMEEQKGDENPSKFSFTSTKAVENQMSCWITYTNPRVHEVLRTGFEFSPMFQGRIQGVGPRYCPSIEDKINRFSERDRHQLFLEPEGRYTNEYYLNGFSSSLPELVQIDAMHLIPGLEHAKVFRPGYAIEYDYFDPTQLKFSLESKLIDGLFLAGQVNGTTGYEEAACQGLMAGINAHLSLHDKQPLILSRSQAYIGVLIDDLVTKGVEDPYRMFTSRAEYRILLRQDNADDRLTPIGHQIGLIDDDRFESLQQKYARQALFADFLSEHHAKPIEVNDYLSSIESSPLTQRTKFANLLLRPQVELNQLKSCCPNIQDFIINNNINEIEQENTEILIKYANYIEKEKEMADKLANLDNIKIAPDFDYKNFPSLSLEAREKLSRVKPENLGQASRISGVSPSDIAALMIYLR